MLANFKVKPIRSEKHRRFIASLPCIITGRGECQAAHIRHGYYGLGTKPSDARCIPLNYEQHRIQHETTELKFYGRKRLDAAIWLSALLYTNTGDYEECCRLIAKFRNDFRE